MTLLPSIPLLSITCSSDYNWVGGREGGAGTYHYLCTTQVEIGWYIDSVCWTVEMVWWTLVVGWWTVSVGWWKLAGGQWELASENLLPSPLPLNQ